MTPAHDTGPAPAPAVRVWSPAVRAGHWMLAASVLACLVLHEGGPWHERLGYAALVVALWRVVHGFVTGDRFARFGAFVRGAGPTLGYASDLFARREAHYTGHNPLGGWMIVLLLAMAVLAGGSGALYATDRFWGDPVLYTVHQIAGWSFALLVPLHLGGVVLTSVLQRENLVRAMLTGHKRDPGPGARADLG